VRVITATVADVAALGFEVDSESLFFTYLLTLKSRIKLIGILNLIQELE
jgi:hypothetical protein